MRHFKLQRSFLSLETFIFHNYVFFPSSLFIFNFPIVFIFPPTHTIKRIIFQLKHKIYLRSNIYLLKKKETKYILTFLNCKSLVDTLNFKFNSLLNIIMLIRYLEIHFCEAIINNNLHDGE